MGLNSIQNVWADVADITSDSSKGMFQVQMKR